MVTLTWLPSMDMPRTILRSTMLMPISGSRTARRLLTTEGLSIKFFLIRERLPSRRDGTLFTLSFVGCESSDNGAGLRRDIFYLRGLHGRRAQFYGVILFEFGSYNLCLSL